MKTIQELEEEYCIAANALTQYREMNGFTPGKRVEATSRNGKIITGVIAPYGFEWDGNCPMNVPILLDEGGVQPWVMSSLKI